MRLSQLIAGIGGERTRPEADPEITGLAQDDRLIEPGQCFVAMVGSRFDSHQFVGACLERGAAAFLLDKRGQLPDGLTPDSIPAPCLVVDDTRANLAVLANRFYRQPTRDLVAVAVTGTNGKTTSTHMLEAVFGAADLPCAVVGTVGYRLGNDAFKGQLTTPNALDLNRLLRRFIAAGAKTLAIEASSHALNVNRLDGALFDAAAFTNLSLDHLDYHGDMESYFAVKRRLFEGCLDEARCEGKAGVAVINADDPYGRRLIAELTGPLVSYSIEGSADVRAENLALERAGSRFELCLAGGERVDVALPLAGRFNVANALAAAGSAEACGVSAEHIAAGLSALAPVPGRLHRVPASGGPAVYIDYAHTPDALGHALAALREISPGRLWVVFGCGGDRDQSKRPEMGRVAAELADCVVVTSDNPRSEDPEMIVDAVMQGVAQVRSGGADEPVWCEVDRRTAIELAVARAGDNDIVLVAGKGHETTQQIGDRLLPLDDAEVAGAALSRR